MTKSLLTPPAGLPVTLAQVKAHLRIETSDDDDHLDELTALAVAHVEQAAGVGLVTQTWRVYLDALPCSLISELPVRPVSQIDAVIIYDADGDPSVIAAGDYQLNAYSPVPRLRFAKSIIPGRAMNGDRNRLHLRLWRYQHGRAGPVDPRDPGAVRALA